MSSVYKKLIALSLSLTILISECSRKDDNQPVSKTTKYYRIKEVDKDGKITYSKVIVVHK